MNNCSIAIQVLPMQQIDSSKESIFSAVDKVLEYIKSTGVKYEVGAFETTLEGDIDELFEISKECQKIIVRNGAGSCMSYIKVNYNENGVSTIEEKVTKHR